MCELVLKLYLLLSLKRLGIRFESKQINTTERFTDKGKLNFPHGGSVLGLSQFSILPQLPLKMMLGLKVVKINSKISNWLC
jgi:hypothetical protein